MNTTHDTTADELATAHAQIARVRLLVTKLTNPVTGFDMSLTEQITRLHVAGEIEAALGVDRG